VSVFVCCLCVCGVSMGGVCVFEVCVCVCVWWGLILVCLWYVVWFVGLECVCVGVFVCFVYE